MDEIRCFVSENKNKIHLFAVTESWLADDIHDCMLSIPNYSIIRNDRKHRKGGGVCIWCNNSISFELFTPIDLQPIEIEVICIVLKVFEFVVCLVYIPPSLNALAYDKISQYLISAYDEVLNV